MGFGLERAGLVIIIFVAECMKFTMLGEYFEDIQTIRESIKIYN
ncbi:hypothetical protein [Clostridium butyricum]|nr:hypothetical protein [Clostridium butyricum]